MRAAESQQASLREYIGLGQTKPLSGVSKPMLIDIDFTPVRPTLLHVILGLVNN